MSELDQKASTLRKEMGCLLGLIGGGLAFASLLAGVCGGLDGDAKNDAPFFFFIVVAGIVGILFLNYGLRLWRRRP